MKKEKYEHCYKKQVERYLLNKMSAEEETFFQEHLDECDDCRNYLKAVRTLSEAFGCDGIHHYTLSSKEDSQVRRFRLGRAMMIAAGVLIIVGVFVYHINRVDEDGTTSHETFINSQPSKADIKNFPAELIFPDSDTLLVNTGDPPLVFRWSIEVPYRIELRSGGEIIVVTDGFGDNYLPDSKSLSGCDSLDWILNVDGEEWKGHIIFTK